MVQLKLSVFAAPKQGNTPDEYEDAWAIDVQKGAVAVADGATEGFASRTWAELLVQAFVEHAPTPSQDEMLAWLEPPSTLWRTTIPWDELTWYTKPKAEQGAFATFLGVSLDQEGDAGRLNWTALAVGDTCLFQIRHGRCLVSFPLVAANDFGSTPPLLGTSKAYSRKSLEDLIITSGELWPGDVLCLCTDALAAWLLRKLENGFQPWADLCERSDEELGQMIQSEQNSGAMRNDDVTLLLLSVASNDPS